MFQIAGPEIQDISDKAESQRRRTESCPLTKKIKDVQTSENTRCCSVDPLKCEYKQSYKFVITKKDDELQVIRVTPCNYTS